MLTVGTRRDGKYGLLCRSQTPNHHPRPPPREILQLCKNVTFCFWESLPARPQEVVCQTNIKINGVKHLNNQPMLSVFCSGQSLKKHLVFSYYFCKFVEEKSLCHPSGHKKLHIWLRFGGKISLSPKINSLYFHDDRDHRFPP